MNDFEFKGCWWHSPSILEPMPGPWCGYEIYGMEVVEAWKRIFDWHRRHGLDSIITQISSHFRDRTVLGWGFQYVLDFERFPEARTFSGDFVGRNQRRMTQVLEQAKQFGINLFIHHYNFNAPKNFVEAHPELLAKWKVTANLKDVPYMARSRLICDRIGTLYGNLCWREPVYKEFMVSVWDELFKTFPALTGILTTPGENQYCLCPDCTRGAKSYEPEELMRARKKIAHEFLGDFCRTFRDTMRSHHKLGIMRLWGIKSSSEEAVDTNLYPKDIPYMIKYHWFDIIDTGPDPLIADWIGRGYEVWVSKEIFGENAGPVEWNRPAYLRDLIQKCRDLGVRSLFSHQNNDWGTAGIPGWLQGLNLTCFARYLNHPEDKDLDWVNAEYTAKFGLCGLVIRKTVEQYCDFVFNITKIVKIGGEGYTFGVPHPLYPGVGRIGNRVDAWVRGNLGELADYIEYAQAHGWDSDLFETLNMKERDPLNVLTRMFQNAETALETLEPLRPQIPTEALGEYEWILTSARLCLHQAREYHHMCRTAVLRAAWLGEKRPEVRTQLKDRALAEMKEAVRAVEQVREDLLEIQTSSMDFHRTLRAPESNLPTDQRTFYLGNRTAELERLTQELGS